MMLGADRRVRHERLVGVEARVGDEVLAVEPLAHLGPVVEALQHREHDEPAVGLVPKYPMSGLNGAAGWPAGGACHGHA